MRRKFSITLAFVTLATVFSPTSVSSATYDYTKPGIWFDYDSSMSRRPEPSFSTVHERGEVATYAEITLPVCETDEQADCISNIEIAPPEGEFSDLELVGYLPVNYSGDCMSIKGTPVKQGCGIYQPDKTSKVTPAKPELNLPEGSKSSIWRIKGDSTSPEKLFLLTLNIFGWINGTVERAMIYGVPIGNNDGKVYWQNFSLNLAPVNIDTGTKEVPKMYAGPYLYSLDDGTCYPSQDGTPFCVRKAYHSNEFQVRLKLKSKFTSEVFTPLNWLSSRSARASYSNTSDEKDSSIRNLVFQGNFTTIYDAGFQFEKTEESFKIYCASLGLNQCANPDLQDIIRRQFMAGTNSSEQGDSPQALDKWISFSKFLEPIERRFSTVWNFHTTRLNLSSGEKVHACTNKAVSMGIKNLVSGLTYSNATIFVPIPPSWDEESQSLELRLASPHANSKGEVIKGFYGLAIEKHVADCLWQVDTSGAKAVLSVFNQDGTQQIVTTSYSVIDGYLVFQMAGFHYSVDTIRVKLITPPRSLPSPSPTAAPQADLPVAKILKSIKCKHGTRVKIVKAISPKCPKGYKRIT